MPYLVVKSQSEVKRISFTAGPSLRHILDLAGIGVRSGCRGIGACGLCLVRVDAGDAGEPSENERIHLSDAQIAKGMRLACRLFPQNDLTVRVMAPAPQSNWRPMDSDEVLGDGTGSLDRPSSRGGWPEDIRNPYGIAVDLGTTHICLSVVSLLSGQRVTGRYGPNPQSLFGADIMTRLERAVESADRAVKMKHLAINAIQDGLRDMAVRDGIDMKSVVTGAVVGNTAMLALLTGNHYDRLLQTDFWSTQIDCLPKKGDTSLAQPLEVHPRAHVTIVPPLAGFVGSDLLAGILASELTASQNPSLFIDFGTNSEIALWDGSVLWVTSAAGGPAFEGSGISCGMPAESGAIYRFHDHTDGFSFDVIDDIEPKGVCGSGLVDLVAGLVRRGALSEIGRYSEAVPAEGPVIVEGRPDLRLQKRDVDLFQRAKAAIGAGVKALCSRAGIGYQDIQRVCAAGALGRFLNVNNAELLGLLPSIAKDRVELCGNTALAGCERALTDVDFNRRLKQILKITQFINLSEQDDFNDLFMENLYLRPVSNGSVP